MTDWINLNPLVTWVMDCIGFNNLFYIFFVSLYNKIGARKIKHQL